MLSHELVNDITTFDRNNLINRLEYPPKIRNWVYKNVSDGSDMFSLATYICNSAGFYYLETKHGWIEKEIPAICDGCQCEVFEYVCSKRMKKVYCLVCWFGCDRKFI